jgi:serine/threonine-protein kinase RsbW
MGSSTAKPNRQKNACKNFVKITYEVPSHRKAVKNLSEMAVKTLGKMEVETNFHHLELVLIEALTNALLYGNLGVPSQIRDTHGEDSFWKLVDEREKDPDFNSKKIVLRIECTQDEIRYTIGDEGDGFDWQEYMKSTDLEDTEECHNRGIFLIKNCVDTLCWSEKGNEMTFTMKLSPKATD